MRSIATGRVRRIGGCGGTVMRLAETPEAIEFHIGNPATGTVIGVAKEAAMSEERRCKSCDKLIPAARLRVMPSTRVCVECSAELGTEDVPVASYESLGKANSIKKTYGGVTIRWRRRH